MSNRTELIALGALSGLFLVSSAAMSHRAAAVSTAPVLDLRFGYSVPEAVAYIESLDTEAKARYATFQRRDGAYMLLYGALFTLAVATFTGTRSPRWRLALAVPITAVVADATEDVLVAAMLRGSLEPTLIQISALATRAKFIFFGGSVALAAGLLLQERIQRLRRPLREGPDTRWS